MTPCTAAHQASLSFTISWSLLKLMSIELVTPSNHLIFCHPLLLSPQSFPASGSFPLSRLFASGGRSIGTSASASVLPVNNQGWFPLGLTGFISFLSKERQALMNLDCVIKSRDITLPSSSYGFSSSHEQLWELNHKCGWMPKNWCFWTVMLEKAFESPSSKEILGSYMDSGARWATVHGVAKSRTQLKWLNTKHVFNCVTESMHV